MRVMEIESRDYDSGKTLLGSKFELFVTRPSNSAVFYATLGFEIVNQKEGGYTTLRNGDVVIALSPVPRVLPLNWLWFLRHPPIGTEIVLYTDRLNELRERLKAAGYKPGNIKQQLWGDKDFRITDHDGYYIRVSEGAPISNQEKPHLTSR